VLVAGIVESLGRRGSWLACHRRDPFQRSVAPRLAQPPRRTQPPM